MNQSVRAVLILLGAFVLFFMYEGHTERVAEEKATAFCSTLSKGSSTDGLLERAMTAGADRRRTQWFHDDEGVDNLSVTYPAALPMNRMICWIKARNRRVVSTEVIFLD